MVKGYYVLADMLRSNVDTTKDEDDLDLLKGVLVVGTLIHKYYEIFGALFCSRSFSLHFNDVYGVFLIFSVLYSCFVLVCSHVFVFQRARSRRSRKRWAFPKRQVTPRNLATSYHLPALVRAFFSYNLLGFFLSNVCFNDGDIILTSYVAQTRYWTTS